MYTYYLNMIEENYLTARGLPLLRWVEKEILNQIAAFIRKLMQIGLTFL